MKKSHIIPLNPIQRFVFKPIGFLTVENNIWKTNIVNKLTRVTIPEWLFVWFPVQNRLPWFASHSLRDKSISRPHNVSRIEEKLIQSYEVKLGTLCPNQPAGSQLIANPVAHRSTTSAKRFSLLLTLTLYYVYQYHCKISEIHCFLHWQLNNNRIFLRWRCFLFF